MKSLFVVLLILLLLFATFTQAQAQNDVPSIDLAGYVWNKTTLNALIITDENQIWWQPYFVNLSKQAIGQWNEAIQFFANKYPDYGYLSSVSISSQVSNTALPNYDIYINFSETVSLSGNDALGLTTTIPYRNGTIEKSIVTLSSRSGPVDLTRAAETNVANHELGHALGLGHSNSSSDLMYPYYDLFSTDNAISTLDLYAVATCFSWITNPGNGTTKLPQFTLLPADIAFEYAPITDPAPRSLDDNPILKALVILFSDPFTAVMAIAFIFFLIVAALVYRSIGKESRKARLRSE